MDVATITAKLSLTRFFRGKGKTNNDAVSKPLAQLVGGNKTASLAKVRMQLLIAAVVLLGVLAVFCFQLMSGYISRAIENETSLVTQQVAARVSSVVDHYSASVSMLAKDPGISELLMRGDQGAIQAKEESLHYVYPDAVNVRLR